MNANSLRSFASVLALGALASAGLGCSSTVTFGGEGEGGGPDCPPGARCGAPEVSDEGIAIRWDQLGGQVASAPGDTLLLAFGSDPTSCANPLEGAPSCTPQGAWEMNIPLPAELQYAGAVVELDELLDVGFGPFFSSSQGEGDGTCSGGGGTPWGTLEVLAIDASSVTIRLSGADVFGPDPNGERTLLRCGGGVTSPPVGPALSMTEQQLDDYFDSLPSGSGTSTASTGGGPTPNDRLFVFIDAFDNTGGLSCGNPYGYTDDCVSERRVVTLAFDASQQAVGTYPIGPSGVQLSFSESGPNGDGSCWGGGGGGFDEGTVTVLAIDDQSIHLQFDSAYGLPDTNVVAPRCP